MHLDIGHFFIIADDDGDGLIDEDLATAPRGNNCIIFIK